MENISANQIKKYLQHQQSVRRASAKYYAKRNGKDYKDPKTGELFEFSKDEKDEDKLNETKLKRKEYHAKRYKEKAEYIKNQTKEYRLRKKEEKLKSKKPLILTEPVSV